MYASVRRNLQVLALLSVSVVFTLTLLEIFLRLFPTLLSEEARLRLHLRGVTLKTTSIAHPYVGFVYPPHSRGSKEHEDFRFTYSTDGHGFRNPWPWPERAEIVAVGDSQTFGYGVADEQAWTALLDEVLPSSRIINLGLIGAAPQQYLRVYETFGIGLQPKVLLFGLFPGNDMGGARNFARWLEAGRPGNYDVWRFFGGDLPEAHRGVSNLIESSYLITYLREAWRIYRSPHSLRGTTLDFPDGSRLVLVPAFLQRAARSARPDDPDFQLVLQTVERARTIAKNHGTEFVVLLIPTKEEVYLPVADLPALDLLAPFRVALEERDIGYINLGPAFRERAEEGERLFFEVDGHPNAAGNALIAESVYSHLQKHAEEYGLSDWN